MSAAGLPVLPTVEAVRVAASRGDAIVWVVRRCAYCRRRHTHLADPVLTSVIIPARCNRRAFYRLVERSFSGSA